MREPGQAVKPVQMPSDRPVPLFRPEVIAHRSRNPEGDILLIPPPSLVIAAWLAAMIGLAAGLLLAFGTYTRTFATDGIVLPSSGLLRIYAPQSGVVLKVDAKERDLLGTNGTICQLRSETESVSRGPVNQAVVESLLDQKSALVTERDHRLQAAQAERSRLMVHRQSIQVQLAALKENLRLAEAEIALSDQGIERTQQLYDSHLISLSELSKTQAANLGDHRTLLDLSREIAALEDEGSKTRSDLEALPHETAINQSQIQRSVSTIETEMDEREGVRALEVKSPVTAFVASLLIHQGQQVSAGEPLAILLPKSSRLEIHFLVDGGTSPFIKVGQRVQIRISGLRYRESVPVTTVVQAFSGAPLSPAEILTRTGLISEKSMYDVTSPLNSASVMVEDQPYAFEPGTQVSVRVMLEKRSLISWFLQAYRRHLGGDAT